MVHIIKKKKGKKIVLYLRHNKWINGRSKLDWQIYLGPEDKIKEKFKKKKEPHVEKWKELEFGAVAALYKLAKEINLVQIIDKRVGKKTTKNPSVGVYILINVINRCVNPTSDNGIADWYKDTFLKRILKVPKKKLSCQNYWNKFTNLKDEIIEQVQIDLSKIVVKKYNLDTSHIIYDTTNFFTYIADHDDNVLPRKGHSKEKQFSRNLIGFGLGITRDYGVPLFHAVYPGNIQDSKIFQEIVPPLLKTVPKQDPSETVPKVTICFDKGNNSKDNIELLKSPTYRFLGSLRPSNQKDLMDVPLSKFSSRYKNPGGQITKAIKLKRNIYGKERAVVVTYDHKSARKRRHTLDSKVEKCFQELDNFKKTKLNVKKWREIKKCQIKVDKMINSMKLKGLIIPELAQDGKKIKMFWSIDSKKYENKVKFFGKSILFTDNLDWSAEEIVRAYRNQWKVENCFKDLKDPYLIPVQPINHWTDRQIITHAFYCYVAILLLSLLKRKLIVNKINLSLKGAIKQLKKIKEGYFKTTNSYKFERKINTLNEKQQKLYEAFGLEEFE
ncbi:MAG: IS1634 family transposase [Candidatus Helarchaeota archaeon]